MTEPLANQPSGDAVNARADDRGVSRRWFIGMGLTGSALAVLGSAGYLALRKGRQTPEAPFELAALDAAVYPVVAAAVEAVVPHAIFSVEALVRRVDEKLSFADAAVVKELHLAFGLLENSLAGLLTRGSAQPFTLLPVEQRTQALLRWRDASVATLNFAYHGIRRIILAAYYASEEAAKAVGYPGAVWEKPSPDPITPRGRLSEPYVPNAAAEAPNE